MIHLRKLKELLAADHQQYQGAAMNAKNWDEFQTHRVRCETLSLVIRRIDDILSGKNQPLTEKGHG